jgi:hypothetical protein
MTHGRSRLGVRSNHTTSDQVSCACHLRAIRNVTKKVRLPGFTNAINVFVILASLFDDEPDVEEPSSEPKEEDMQVALASFQ